VTIRKHILFIAEERDDDVNTPGYISTSTEPYTTYYIEVFTFYKCKNIVVILLVISENIAS
jgi:hypothetical protein